MKGTVAKQVLAILCMLLVSIGASAKDNIAILPFTGGQGEDGETIAELFSYDQRINEVFNVIPRTSITQALQTERAFQTGSGMTDPESIVAIGRQLGAQYIIAGSIARLGSNRLLVVTIMRIDNLQEIAGDFQTYSRIEEIRDKLPGMAQSIIAATGRAGENLPRLAIVPFQLKGTTNEQDADVLAQILAIDIVRSGKYAVYPRTATLEQVQEEYRNQAKGETAEEEAVGIGHGENPEYVLSGAGRSLGSENLFNASILDLKTGIQVRGSSVNYRSLDDGIGAMGALVEKLTGAAVEPLGGGTEPAGGGAAIGRNLGIGALNMVLGLGSFLVHKDLVGGFTLLGGYAIAGGLIGWEMALDPKSSMAGIPGAIGLGVAGVTVIYGFIRPFLYERSQKVAEVLDGVQVSVLPEVRGGAALRLAYRWKVGSGK